MPVKLYCYIFILVMVGSSCSRHADTIYYANRCCQQENSLFFVKVNYPEFVSNNKPDKQICDSLNYCVNSLVEELIDVLWCELLNERFRRQNKSNGAKWELVVDYDLTIYTSRLVSTRFSIFYFKGQSHGYTFFRNLNFQIDPFKRLRLEDVVYIGERAELVALNKLLIKNIQKPDECFLAKPLVTARFDGFSFENEYMVFSFQDTGDIEYVCGPLEVHIPLNEIKQHGLLKMW